MESNLHQQHVKMDTRPAELLPLPQSSEIFWRLCPEHSHRNAGLSLHAGPMLGSLHYDRETADSMPVLCLVHFPSASREWCLWPVPRPQHRMLSALTPTLDAMTQFPSRYPFFSTSNMCHQRYRDFAISLSTLYLTSTLATEQLFQ